MTAYRFADAQARITCLDPSERENISDGDHTFKELYEHRHALFIALIQHPGPYLNSWKAKYHSDGSLFDGWFIAGIGTLPGHTISYHFPVSMWEELKTYGSWLHAPKWDGHTAKDVVERLKKPHFWVPSQEEILR